MISVELRVRAAVKDGRPILPNVVDLVEDLAAITIHAALRCLSQSLNHRDQRFKTKTKIVGVLAATQEGIVITAEQRELVAVKAGPTIPKNAVGLVVSSEVLTTLAVHEFYQSRPRPSQSQISETRMQIAGVLAATQEGSVSSVEQTAHAAVRVGQPILWSAEDLVVDLAATTTHAALQWSPLSRLYLCRRSRSLCPSLPSQLHLSQTLTALSQSRGRLSTSSLIAVTPTPSASQRPIQCCVRTTQDIWATASIPTQPETLSKSQLMEQRCAPHALTPLVDGACISRSRVWQRRCVS